MSSDGQVTRILQRISAGEQDAVQELLPAVYEQLRQQARYYMAHERHDHTLQATALVNEAFMKLVNGRGFRFASSRHFYNAAAEAMRRILVDHARKKRAEKRGGNGQRVELDEIDLPGPTDSVDYESLDRALNELKRQDPRRHQVVMYRFFAGLEEKQIAELMDVSEKTVRRDWQTAKVFLLAKMSGA